MRVKTKQDRRRRIQFRSRTRVAGTVDRPRLAVFRSAQHIYAQAIDDASGRTVVAASSMEPTVKASLGKATSGGNVAGAKAVGKAVAERLIASGVKQVVFDRGGFLYHGRVRAMAEAAREAGLKF
ncbi:MAG: 50S ribosomal protein L18 [Acidobacteria bacterium]|jgi:large subunit ribosomal protein L18|nr:50S ribosomal protein L18 [Acidobacteriota bacterium]|tara:strand:+ start:3478 stop:3852 length:375 start_codon:yes stop_codon:yes gene_type:complete